MVSIAADEVNIRSGPGTRYEVLWQFFEGYPLLVLKTKGDWLQIRDFEGDEGWVHERLTNNLAHLVVKKNRINMRSGPGTKFRVIATAEYGVVFRTIERKKNWVKVKHDNGTSGWVYRKLLWGW
jgi:SH3-like domain-containing protein